MQKANHLADKNNYGFIGHEVSISGESLQQRIVTIKKAGKQDRQQIPDRAMPLSLSSFCPLLGISTGVLCAKTNRADQQKILHNSSCYLSAFKNMFNF